MAGKGTLLKLVFFKTADANWMRVRQPLIEGGNALLAPYNMKLDYPKGDPIGIPFQGVVYPFAGDAAKIRQQCHEALPVGIGVPIIFIASLDQAGAFGETYKTGDPLKGTDWPSFCVITTNHLNRALSTLVHELIHTTYKYNPSGDDHDGPGTSAFSEKGNIDDFESGPPVDKHLSKKQAERLRQMYYSYPA